MVTEVFGVEVQLGTVGEWFAGLGAAAACGYRRVVDKAGQGV